MMKRKSLWRGVLILLAYVLTSGPRVWAQVDSLMLEELVVVGTRPGERTPITKQKLEVEQLKNSSTAWDVPTLLQGTPSLVVTNESGVFGGYTYFSIRGVDPSRVNITINGVPVNDSESQTVFWANMPDFGERLQDIVIVRGAGASSFGAGAFGATMDMRIANPQNEAGGKAATYWGSYGLQRHLVALRSGRLRSGWNLEGQLSQIASNGYVDRSGGKGTSYLFQAHHVGEKHSFQLIHHRGVQETGIAWNGITEQEIRDFGRTFNSTGWMNPGEKEQKKHCFYQNNDNYDQSHTYAIWRHFPKETFQYELTLHYTKGEGYTHEYRTKRKYKEFGLVPSDNNLRGDLVREKYLDNHFIGGIANFGWRVGSVHMSGGAALNHYSNVHYGKILYVKEGTVNYTLGQEYYRNHSIRTDGSFYLRGEWELQSNILLYADVLYRYIQVKMEGNSDRWNSHTNSLDLLDYQLPYNFFLPKVGVSWSPNLRSRVYFSIATAGKEPNRKMYTESKEYDERGDIVMPRPEYMLDFELGGNWQTHSLSFFANMYYMLYRDQLVQNGKQSDVGEPLLINVPQSFRAGVELGTRWKVGRKLMLSANATFSRNRIKDFVLVESNTSTWKEEEVLLKNTPIAKSPEVILNHTVTWYPVDRLSVMFSGNFVGRQFLDNSGFDGRSLPGYYSAQLMMNYNIPFSSGQRLDFQAQVLNLFNATYATNGWVWGYIDEVDGKKQHGQEVGLFPAAPIHFVAGVTINF